MAVAIGLTGMTTSLSSPLSSIKPPSDPSGLLACTAVFWSRRWVWKRPSASVIVGAQVGGMARPCTFAPATPRAGSPATTTRPEIGPVSGFGIHKSWINSFSSLTVIVSRETSRCRVLTPGFFGSVLITSVACRRTSSHPEPRRHKSRVRPGPGSDRWRRSSRSGRSRTSGVERNGPPVAGPPVRADPERPVDQGAAGQSQVDPLDRPALGHLGLRPGASPPIRRRPPPRGRIRSRGRSARRTHRPRS